MDGNTVAFVTDPAASLGMIVTKFKQLRRVLQRGFGVCRLGATCGHVQGSATPAGVLSLGQPEVSNAYLKQIFNYALKVAALILNTNCPMRNSFLVSALS